MQILYFFIIIILPVLFLAKSKIFRITTYNEKYLAKNNTDIFKGLSVVIIIIHHLSLFLVNSGMFKTIFSRMGFLAVSIFLSLSGYGLMFQFSKRKETYFKGYFKNKIIRLYLIFVSANVVSTLISNIFLSSKYSIKDVIKSCLLMNFADGRQLWFVAVILYFYIAFYIAFKFFDKNMAILIMFVSVVIWSIVNIFLHHGAWFYNTSICFPLGIMIANYNEQIFKLAKKYYSFLLLVSIVSFLLSMFFYIKGKDSLQFIIPLIFIILMLLFLMKVDLKSKSLIFMNSISFEFYLLQIIILNVVFQTKSTMSSLYFFVALVITVIVSKMLNIFIGYIFTIKINSLKEKVEISKRKLNLIAVSGIMILIFVLIGINIFLCNKSQIIKNNIDPTSSNATDILSDRLLIWSDEFNEKTLDTNKWRYVVGRRDLDDGTPRQYYPLDQSKNVYTEDGALVLKALRNNPYPNYEWSAAFVETNNLFEFQYGRIEARIKFSSVPGSYATLWTLGANFDRTQKLVNGESNQNIGVPWPKCGEMDIAEFNSAGSPAADLHYGDDTSTHKQVGGTSLGVNGTEWHIYSVEWTKESIKFYVDGVLKKSAKIDDLTYNNYNSFRSPFYLMINSGVSNDQKPSKGINEETTLVDWVRVYAPVGISKIINANSITLDTNQLNLKVGDTYALNTTFTPDETSDKTLKWTSSDDSVAMVYGGKITALKSGTAIITAETKNNKKVTCKVTVTG